MRTPINPARTKVMVRNMAVFEVELDESGEPLVDAPGGTEVPGKTVEVKNPISAVFSAVPLEYQLANPQKKWYHYKCETRNVLDGENHEIQI